jgi:hypothetical protein
VWPGLSIFLIVLSRLPPMQDLGGMRDAFRSKQQE